MTFISRQAPATRTNGVATRDCLTVQVWELLALAILIVVYTAADLALGPEGAEIVNVTGPYAFTAILLYGAGNMLRQEKLAMWTGLFWLRVASAIYFGLGTIAHTWMNWYTLNIVNTFYNTNAEHYAKFNLLVTWSVLVLLGAAGASAHVFRRRSSSPPIEMHDSILLVIAIVASSVGYFVKFFITFPADMGVFGDRESYTLPGMLVSLTFLSGPGLFLLSLWSQKNDSTRVKILVFGLLTMDFLVGSLRFSKSEVLLPAMMYILAWLFIKATPARLTMSALLLIFIFTTLQPMVEFGRNAVGREFGNISGGSISDRAEILSEYWFNPSAVGAVEDTQGVLMRISYVTTASAALDLYDAGRGGDTLSMIFTMFIPRIIWPDKPIYDIGAKFNAEVNGSSTSASWFGMYAEAYYNFGWLGILIMLPLGIGLFLSGRYAQFVLDTQRWLHFPGVFFGMFTGVTCDGAIVVGAVSMLMVGIIYHFTADLGLRVLTGMLKGTKKMEFEQSIRAGMSAGTLPAREKLRF